LIEINYDLEEIKFTNELQGFKRVFVKKLSKKAAKKVFNLNQKLSSGKGFSKKMEIFIVL
jgi:hypothetical protein